MLGSRAMPPHHSPAYKSPEGEFFCNESPHRLSTHTLSPGVGGYYWQWESALRWKSRPFSTKPSHGLQNLFPPSIVVRCNQRKNPIIERYRHGQLRPVGIRHPPPRHYPAPRVSLLRALRSAPPTFADSFLSGM